jgi:hypothetical protein
MGVAKRAGNIGTPVDCVNPCRTGIRRHNAIGAKHGQAADNAEAPIHGFLRQRLTAWNGNLNGNVQRRAVRDGCQIVLDDLARAWIDRWFADGQRQARCRYRTNAVPCQKRQPATRRQQRHARFDGGTMGHIWIVACVFNNGDHGAAIGFNFGPGNLKVRAKVAREQERG